MSRGNFNVSPTQYAMPKACNFIKKETLVQLFSCEFFKISKNTYFTELLLATASKIIFNYPLKHNEDDIRRNRTWLICSSSLSIRSEICCKFCNGYCWSASWGKLFIIIQIWEYSSVLNTWEDPINWWEFFSGSNKWKSLDKWGGVKITGETSFSSRFFFNISEISANIKKPTKY